MSPPGGGEQPDRQAHGRARAPELGGWSFSLGDGIHPLTDNDFELLRKLILREAGIYLSDEKKVLLACRLRSRLRELGMRSFTAYYRLVKAEVGERARMLDRITTNETHFFRDPDQFELLKKRVLPAWRRAARERARTRIRVWSTACSTGEEPFSIAMFLLYHFPDADLHILATDLSGRVLETAQGATWPFEKAEEIPRRYLKRFMLRGTGPQEGWIRASPEIRSLVSFRRLNLNDDEYQVPGPFDLIYCRNVLIYFDRAAKSRVIGRLGRHLAQGGLLLLGRAESLIGVTDELRALAPTVYAGRSSSERSPVPASGAGC